MRDLTATELTRMRDTQESAFPSTCTIQEPVESQDSIGQPIISWVARASDVECRLNPRETSQVVMELALGNRDTPVSEWVLTVAWDQTILTGDRVVYGTRTFEVVSAEVGESWKVATRAGLLEVT